MGRAVAQIEQEIAALDQTVSAMAQAFYDTYQQYLTALGKAMRQQFVLAGFHICTHAYPEQFLSLSLEQRKALQQSLQALAKQGQADLLDCLTPVQVMVAPGNSLTSEEDDTTESNEQEDLTDLDISEQAPTEPALQDLNLHGADFEAGSLEHESSPESNSEPNPESEQPNLELSLEQQEVNEFSDLSHSEQVAILLVTSDFDRSQIESQTLSTNDSPDRPLHPKDIAYWQSQLEEAIAEVLQNLSHTTNCVLQQANILPSRLPEPVLEVAAKADLSSEATASPPNLLNLLIEADGEDEKLAMTQVMAMRLRLSEIEFGDATTAALRSKLRQLMAQLSKLGREYQRKQKEHAVAQAEAAWRMSWSE